MGRPTVDLAGALGLSGENESMDFNVVTQTKQRLGEWRFTSSRIIYNTKANVERNETS